MSEKTCLSCKQKTVNDPGMANFSCPACGKYEITRCSNCKRNAVKYQCPSCNFRGPN